MSPKWLTGFSRLPNGSDISRRSPASMGERIEVSHKASNRSIYAQGSLRAARFLAGQRTGLFGMNDVLGFAR